MSGSIDRSMSLDERRHLIREELRVNIESHLIAEVTVADVENNLLPSAGTDSFNGTPKKRMWWYSDWQRIRFAANSGAELWKFDTTEVVMGFASGEEGFALVSDENVVDWVITAINA